MIKLTVKIFDLSKPVRDDYALHIGDMNIPEILPNTGILKVKTHSGIESFTINGTLFFDQSDRMSSLPCFEQKLHYTDAFGSLIREGHFLLKGFIEIQRNVATEHFFRENPTYLKYDNEIDILPFNEPAIPVKIIALPMKYDCVEYKDKGYVCDRLIYVDGKFKMQVLTTKSIAEYRASR